MTDKHFWYIAQDTMAEALTAAIWSAYSDVVGYRLIYLTNRDLFAHMHIHGDGPVDLDVGDENENWAKACRALGVEQAKSIIEWSFDIPGATKRQKEELSATRARVLAAWLGACKGRRDLYLDLIGTVSKLGIARKFDRTAEWPDLWHSVNEHGPVEAQVLIDEEDYAEVLAERVKEAA